MELYKAYRQYDLELDPFDRPAEVVVNHFVWDLFSKSKVAVTDNNPIVVTGSVASDGLGDWASMLKLAKHLKRQFPAQTVLLLAESDPAHRKHNLKGPDTVESSIVYRKYGSRRVHEAEILQKVQNASLIFVGPVSEDGRYDEIVRQISMKTICVHECDASTNVSKLNVVSDRPTSSRKTVRLGLWESSNGIFTNSQKKYSWRDVQNEILKTILFNTDNPTDQEINDYQSQRILYFCYTSPYGALKFIKDVAFFERVSDKMIDISIPCKGSIELMTEYLWELGLEEYGVGSVRILCYEKGQPVEKIIKLSNEGKEIRIVDAGPLVPRDFKILVKISAAIVGVAADDSLAQALSYGKIPFCDFEGHKNFLISGLVKIIGQRCGLDSVLYQYVQAVHLDDERQCFLASPDLVSQSLQLAQEICEKHSINTRLKGVANEFFFSQLDSKYDEYKAELMEEFSNDMISFDELEKSMRAYLGGHPAIDLSA